MARLAIESRGLIRVGVQLVGLFMLGAVGALDMAFSFGGLDGSTSSGSCFC